MNVDNSASLLSFNGQAFDPVSGSYHLGNGYRTYSPVLRQFLSPDSMSPFGGGGINPYAYCAGDPINHSDPSGHFHIGPINLSVMSVIGLVAAGAGVAAAVFTGGGSLAMLGAGLGLASAATGVAADSTEGAVHKALAGVSLGAGVLGIAADFGGAALPRIAPSMAGKLGLVPKAREVAGMAVRFSSVARSVEPARAESELAIFNRSIRTQIAGELDHQEMLAASAEYNVGQDMMVSPSGQSLVPMDDAIAMLRPRVNEWIDFTDETGLETREGRRLGGTNVPLFMDAGFVNARSVRAEASGGWHLVRHGESELHDGGVPSLQNLATEAVLRQIQTPIERAMQQGMLSQATGRLFERRNLVINNINLRVAGLRGVVDINAVSNVVNNPPMSRNILNGLLLFGASR